MSIDPQTPPAIGARTRRPPIWNLPVCLATGGYVGLIPFMPGTFGTVVGIPLAYGLGYLPHLWMQLLLLAVIWGLSVPICTAAAALMGVKDPGAIVLDEIVAVPIAYLGFQLNSPAVIVVGFLLFRVFDILKPPPVRQLERLPRGLGIMADDVVAALYAQLVMRLLVLTGLL